MNEPILELEAYFAGHATEEQFRAIEAWINEGSDNAKAFMEQIHFREVVGQHLRERADHASLALSELARLEDKADPILVTLHDGSDWDTPKPSARQWRDALAYLLSHTFTPKRLIAGGIAAALVLAAVLAIVLLPGPDTPKQIAVEPSEDVPIAPDNLATSPTVATLTAIHNAQWAPTGGALAPPSLTPGSKIHPNQQLTLTQGFATITTNSGAIAILQAPATIELLDNDNALRLHSGKLVGICESELSKGFTVHTPSARLVDVGTVFGVEVGPETSTMLHVMQGQVNAAPMANGQQVGVYVPVNARHAVVIQHGKGLRAIDFDQHRFAQSLPLAHGTGLAAGDTILIDLGWQGEGFETLEGNVNNISGASIVPIFTVGDEPRTLLTDIIRTRDGANTGVRFSIERFTGEPGAIIGFGGKDVGEDVPSIAGFPASVMRDTIFRKGSKDPAIRSVAVLRFSNLDDNLIYDLTLASFVNDFLARPDSIFTASGKTGSYNPVKGGSTTLKGLTTDGQGNLDITWTLSEDGTLEDGSNAGQLDGIRLQAAQRP